MPDLQPGDLIGPYRLEARLGRGGQAQVWRAVHETLGLTRALKIVSGDDHALLDEARVQAELRHPHIVEVIDVLRHGDRAALVTELVEGPTLAERLAADPLPPAEALRIFDAVAFAVATAHRAGIVHGDISASNVLLDMRQDPPRPMLADFGLAGRAGAAPDPGRGTDGYLAPERQGGAPPSRAADVYGLGALLDRILPTPDADMAALIAALTAQSPADRPGDGAAVLARLRPPEVDVPSTPTLAPRSRSRIRRPPWWLAFAVGAVFGALMWAALSG